MTENKPTNILINGMTNCGKTFYMLKMLEEEYSQYFDYIFLICPTYPWNKTYHNWKYNNDPKFIVIPCDQDEIESRLKYVVDNFAKTKSLIILDDCASSSYVKKNTSELVKLGMSARHMGLSTIVITQYLKSVAKQYRAQLTKLVTFYVPSKNDTDIIFNEHLDVSKDERREIIDKLKNNDYSRLEINLSNPRSHRVVING